jgi:hypothetical protein
MPAGSLGVLDAREGVDGCVVLEESTSLPGPLPTRRGVGHSSRLCVGAVGSLGDTRSGTSRNSVLGSCAMMSASSFRMRKARPLPLRPADGAGGPWPSCAQTTLGRQAPGGAHRVPSQSPRSRRPVRRFDIRVAARRACRNCDLRRPPPHVRICITQRGGWPLPTVLGLSPPGRSGITHSITSTARPV